MSRTGILSLKISCLRTITRSRLLILGWVTRTKRVNCWRLLAGPRAMPLLKWFKAKDMKVLRLISGPAESFYLLCWMVTCRLKIKTRTLFIKRFSLVSTPFITASLNKERTSSKKYWITNPQKDTPSTKSEIIHGWPSSRGKSLTKESLSDTIRSLLIKISWNDWISTISMTLITFRHASRQIGTMKQLLLIILRWKSSSNRAG